MRIDQLSGGHLVQTATHATSAPPPPPAAAPAPVPQAAPPAVSAALMGSGEDQSAHAAMLEAVNELRQSISTVRNTDLHFNVDPDSRQVQMEIVDRGTGDVVRQIPEEALVRFAKAFDAWLGTLLDKEA